MPNPVFVRTSLCESPKSMLPDQERKPQSPIRRAFASGFRIWSEWCVFYWVIVLIGLLGELFHEEIPSVRKPFSERFEACAGMFVVFAFAVALVLAALWGIRLGVTTTGSISQARKEGEGGVPLAKHPAHFQFGLHKLLLFTSATAVFLALNRVVVVLLGLDILAGVYIAFGVSLVVLGLGTATVMGAFAVSFGCTILVHKVITRWCAGE